jgi:cobalt/nickel transport system permease protein
VAPFALLVGAFNPLLDRELMTVAGGVEIAGGWVSYASILLRFLLTASAALVLTATTGFTGVCLALEKLRLPDVLVTQLLLLYRYIFVLGDEALRMGRARSLRSVGRRGTGVRVYAQMLGQLLLRTFARAQRVYLAMKCRGFDGQVRIARRLRVRKADVVFVLGWSALFVVFRFVDVSTLLGRLATGAG